MTRIDTHIRMEDMLHKQITDEAAQESRKFNNMANVLLVEALQQREKKRKRRKKNVTQASEG